MTRDEAIKTYFAEIKKSQQDVYRDINAPPPWISGYISGLVALGILKLDEPKTIRSRLCDALEKSTLSVELVDRVASGKILYPSQLVQIMDEAGLKIVEK